MSIPVITNRAARTSNHVRYNEQTYVQHVFLSNQSGNTIAINPSTINELVIEDDIFSWFVHGYMIIADYFNVIERSPSSLPNQPFKYRTDGRDLLVVDIMPLFDEQDASMIDINRYDLWLKHYEFAITDIQDISEDNNETKVYKLSFWERPYQRMLDSNIEWSTATSKYNKSSVPLRKRDNAQRSLRVGQALIDILETNGFTEMIDYDNFDLGADDNLVFYTSPSNANVIDDFEFFLKQHVSATGEPCIISYDGTNEETGAVKKFTMIPYSKFFADAGKASNAPGSLQMEHFFIREAGPEDFSVPIYKAPMSIFSKDRDLKLNAYNQVLSYRFTPTAGSDNVEQFKAFPQYHFSGGSKQMIFDYGAHTPSGVRSYMNKTYLSNVLTKDQQPSTMVLNQTKTQGLSVQPVWTSIQNHTGRNAEGRNNLIKSAIHLSSCLSFAAMGLLFRTTGTFIGVDKVHGDTDNDFDNRLLGQWFVTCVRHHFVGSSYNNYITAVKTHTYEHKIQIDEQIP